MDRLNSYEMEVYSLNQQIIEQRRSEYFNRLHEYYKDSQEISLVEYKRIRDSLNGGDRSVLSSLAEKSIYYIIISVSKLYAKYDIDSYMPIEEAFSYAYAVVSKYVDTFNKLPQCRAEYVESTINFLAYKVILRHYQRERRNIEKTILMAPSDLAWTIDQIEKDEMHLNDLNNADLNRIFEKMKSILREREIKIISLKFGLNGEEVKTYKEIGDMYGVTRGRAE